MILVGQYDSPVTRRVAVTLHHYGIPFSRDTSSIFGDAAHVQTINPLIRIPALISGRWRNPHRFQCHHRPSG